MDNKVIELVKAYEAKETIRRYKAAKKRKELLERLKYMGRFPPDGPDAG